MKRPEPIELENNLGPDAVTGEINRVPWMAYDVDEMDLYIAEKDKEIAELKDKRLDVKDFAHVLKAFKFYLCQLTHCAYDERTAQWIIDNWEQDYERVEEYKG